MRSADASAATAPGRDGPRTGTDDALRGRNGRPGCFLLWRRSGCGGRSRCRSDLDALRWRRTVQGPLHEPGRGLRRATRIGATVFRAHPRSDRAVPCALAGEGDLFHPVLDVGRTRASRLVAPAVRVAGAGLDAGRLLQAGAGEQAGGEADAGVFGPAVDVEAQVVDFVPRAPLEDDAVLRSAGAHRGHADRGWRRTPPGGVKVGVARPVHLECRADLETV